MSYPAPIFNWIPGLAKSMHPKAAYTRASTGSVFDSSGILRSAASGLPRFDADPLTGLDKGFLVEESRANLLTYSEQFDNAAWNKVRLNVSGTPAWVNQAVAPDGTTTAEKLIEDTTASNSHYLSCSAVTLGSVAMVGSVFLKAGERTKARVILTDYVSATVYVDVDLSNGTLGSPTVQAPWSSGTVGIIGVGGGWYRVYVGGTAGQGAQKAIEVRLLDASGNQSYTGDGTSGLYIWGAQLEAGSFPTSYIPTTTASATRSADVCTVTLSNLVGPHGEQIWNGVEGTLLVRAFIPYQFANTQSLCCLSDGSANNRALLLNWGGGSTIIGAVVHSGGVNQFVPTGFALSSRGVLQSVALAYKASDYAFCMNGASPQTQASGAVPVSMTTIHIGTAQSAAIPVNGHIKQVTLWNRRLTNADLQALTA
jgi:hypothetical protein